MSRHLVFSFDHNWFECRKCGARSLFVHPLYFRDWLEDFRRFASQHRDCARKEAEAA